MYAASGIRKLARSEEMFAETHNFVGLGATVSGPIDVDALTEAFDALLETHPVLGGHLEKDPEGRWEIVVDDLMHPGIIVVEPDDPAAEVRPPRFDQTQSLVHLRVVLRGNETETTLYIHHALADGHHEFSLIEEVFSSYTDLVTTGSLRPTPPKPAPSSLETVLAERGVEKVNRSGLERFMPALFAHELPPSRRSASADKPRRPTLVPMADCHLSIADTKSILDYARSNKVSLNGILSAVILIAEWRLRGSRPIPVPYIYPVDLRYVLTPPVGATDATNPVGVATYLAEIDSRTDVLDLARSISDAFKADLAEGVIQQSLLHFTPQYDGNPPGLPDVVMMTDNGIVPPMRTPAGVELVTVKGEVYFQVGGGIEMYTSKIFNGQMIVEYHSHGPEPEKSVAVIEELLTRLASEAAATTTVG